MANNSKLITDGCPDYLVLKMSASAANFAQCLGISTKREEELCELIGKCYDDTDTYPKAIEMLYLEVNNMNEYTYCLFHLGAYAGNEQARRTMIKTQKN